MVRRLLLIFSLTIFISSNAHALSAYVGASQNFGGVGAARIGFGDWEIGRFSPTTIAANKIFKMGNKYYATLGFGLAIPVSPAFVAGAGFNYFNLVGFSLRGELFAFQSISGLSSGGATLGISWNF